MLLVHETDFRACSCTFECIYDPWDLDLDVLLLLNTPK